MKAMRFETLEPLCEVMNPLEVAKMAFQLADQTVRELRQSCGLELDFVEQVILNDRYFSREDVQNLERLS